MLCTPCQQKITIQTPGRCNACNGATTHFAYALCDICSQLHDECAWCQTPLSQPVQGNPSPPSGATPFYTLLNQSDNGTTATGIKVGEQIHVTLDEDQYAWIQWDTKRYDKSRVKLVSKGPFVVNDPNDPQYGTRTFIFDVIATGNVTIEFHEVDRTWSWYGMPGTPGQPVPGGQTWSATAQVN